MVTTSHAPSPRKRQKGAFTRNFKKNYQYYLLLLPAVIWYAIFCYGPMYGVQIAFRNYNGALGMLGSPWVGLKHLVSFFESYYFGTLVKNTLAISLYSLATCPVAHHRGADAQRGAKRQIQKMHPDDHLWRRTLSPRSCWWALSSRAFAFHRW